MSEYKEVPSSAARAFCEALFVSYGFTGEESAVIADVILAADFAGIESHGLQRVIRYDEEIHCGCVDTAARPELVFQTKLSSVYDAHKAMGQLMGARAVDEAIAKAKEHGFGIVTARNSNHIGIAGYYAERAASAGLAGICMTNTEAIAVPVNGSKGMLGTNPIAFAMDGFSFDSSTTVVSRGKIEVYAKNKMPLPAGWAVDAEGSVTYSAADVIRRIVHKLGGGILPAGGHKGFGLGIIVEISTAIFSGGMTSNHVNVVPGHTGMCNCFIALDYGMFGDSAALREALRGFLEELRESPPAKGQNRIFVPGDRKAELSARRRNGTIPLSQPTLDELRIIADKQQVAFPL